MNDKDLEPILVNEHEVGTCKMVDSLEQSYLLSCKHNKTTPEDLEYFRQYVWNLLSILHQSISLTQK